MDFKTLNATIPYVSGGKKHLLSYSPYNGITLRLPGRHAKDTDPIGGDFVVCVDDESMGWVSHQFTHDDLFEDFEKKTATAPQKARILMGSYSDIVMGADPAKYNADERPAEWAETLHPKTLLYAVQCLAIAEHRRYHKFESKGGGRFLPARFTAGIVEGLWTAADARAVQRRGRPGVEMLERLHGKPPLRLDWAA